MLICAIEILNIITLYFLLKHNRKKTMTTMKEILHPQRIEVCLNLLVKWETKLLIKLPSNNFSEIPLTNFNRIITSGTKTLYQ